MSGPPTEVNPSRRAGPPAPVPDPQVPHRGADRARHRVTGRGRTLRHPEPERHQQRRVDLAEREASSGHHSDRPGRAGSARLLDPGIPDRRCVGGHTDAGLSAFFGIIGAYIGGAVDDGFSLFSNVMLVIPGLPLVIVIASYIQNKSVFLVILVLALTGWAAGSRVLRSQTLSVRNRDYVLAARVAGEKDVAGRLRRDPAESVARHVLGLRVQHPRRHPRRGGASPSSASAPPGR